MTVLRVLGIDPGTRVAGYGIVDADRRGILPVACGAWELGKDLELFMRLGKLSLELDRIFRHYAPTHLCLEEAFVAKNMRSALLIGHARGVVMARAHEHGVVFVGMSPTQAKSRVTGSGAASKHDMALSVTKLLGIQTETKLPFDATDALGLAYACAQDLRLVLREKSFAQKCS